MALRLREIGAPKYRFGFAVTLHEKALAEPFGWRKPRGIFMCSMADIFHSAATDEFLDRILAVMRQTPRHRYYLLTKRAERMAEFFTARDAPRNLWLGVTIENRAAKYRLQILREINAAGRFICCEPLLEDLGDLNLAGINWVIAGAESGQRARRADPEWFYKIANQAKAQNSEFSCSEINGFTTSKLAEKAGKFAEKTLFDF
jgi:protein gp37